MKAQANDEYQRVLKAIRDCKKPGQKVYLVGGAVRDLLLDLPLNDFDFVVEKGSKELARCLRQALHGASFALDDVRGFNRVVLNGGTPEERFVDIAEFVGDDLEADLHARDFTINAMAIDVDDPGRLIDPLGGCQDLENSVLKLASDHAFESDPLRVIRAARMAHAFQLHFADGTVDLLRDAKGRLAEVSSERVRDELFKILNLENVEVTLTLLWQLGVLNEIFPCVPAYLNAPDDVAVKAFEHQLRCVAKLSFFFDLINDGNAEEAVPTAQVPSEPVIWTWKHALKAFLGRQITRGRTSGNLLILLALLLREDRRDDAPGSIQALIRDIKLSNEEASFLSRIERAFHSEFWQKSRIRDLNDLEIYQLLKKLKDATPGYCLIGIAFARTDGEWDGDQQKCDGQFEAMKKILSIWFERGQEIMKPELLMDGVAMMDYAGLAPGPIVGELLDQLEEAQFLGWVTTVTEAKALVDTYLSKPSR